MALTVDLTTTTTSNKTEASLTRLGMSQPAARTAAPLISFVDGDEPADKEQTIYITCRQSYTRVVITCDMEELRPSPAFITAIENILNLPTEERQVEGLRRVLRQWGAVFATYIELGCALVTTRDFVTPCDIPGVSGR
jgi:hypothetical protein